MPVGSTQEIWSNLQSRKPDVNSGVIVATYKSGHISCALCRAIRILFCLQSTRAEMSTIWGRRTRGRIYQSHPPSPSPTLVALAIGHDGESILDAQTSFHQARSATLSNLSPLFMSFIPTNSNPSPTPTHNPIPYDSSILARERVVCDLRHAGDGADMDVRALKEASPYLTLAQESFVLVKSGLKLTD